MGGACFHHYVDFLIILRSRFSLTARICLFNLQGVKQIFRKPTTSV